MYLTQNTIMKEQFHVTVTLTRDELYDLCAALHDSTSYWYKHLRNAQTEKNYFLSANGAELVYDQRSNMYTKFNDVYHATFGDED
jgi:hypothetical protein